MKPQITVNKLVWVVLVAVLLVGCNSQDISPTVTEEGTIATDTPAPEPVTITAWEWRGGALASFIEQEAGLFKEQYPWITVDVVQFPDRRAYREALALAFESQDAPDAFIRPHSLSQLIDDGWVQPLDPWITEAWRDKFPPGSFAETRNIWQGSTYSFPVFAEGAQRMFFLNEDMFRQAGLVDDNGEILTPETWEDLRTMSAEITRAGEGDFYGIGIGIKDPRDISRWFDMASLAGAPMTPYDYHFRTGEFIYGLHPGYARIIELLLGMKEDGSVYPYESTLEDGNIYTYFAQGKFAMFMSGSYVVSNLSADFPEFQDYRIVPLPIPEEGQSGEYNLLPGTGVYYMSADTKHPDEAWLWLDWLSTRDHHKRMVAQTSNFSVYADLNTAENIQDEHTLQAYEALTAYGVYGPFPPARNPQTALVSPEPVTPDAGDLLVGIYTGQIEDWQSALDDLDMRKQMAFEDALLAAQDNGVNVSWEDFIFIDWNPMEDYLNYPTE